MDNNIGKKLDGRYELLELIGVGGMADIYRARDIQEERIVAVKILKTEFAGSDEFLRRFRNESKAIALLSHQNIVKIYDVGFTDKVQFIVMEYVDGITLTDYIEQQGVLKWRDAVHFTVQVLRALQHAHDRGIVHRDVKSSNIMLLRDGTIKVMDFGIARFNRENNKTMSEKTIGSVHYISPEQARGDITDERSDIYSVGVALYEMLTGRKPFDGDTPVAIALKHMQSMPKRPSEINETIPEGLEQIVLRAMQKEPSARYQTAGEMIGDLEEFKKNPGIVFDYKYNSTDGTAKYIDRPNPAVEKESLRRKRIDPEDDVDYDDDDDYYDDDDELEERRSPLIPILFAVGAAFVIATVFLLLHLVVKEFGPGSSTISSNTSNSLDLDPDGNFFLPNFVGKSWEEINAQYGNQILFDIQQEWSDVEKDHVIEQEPAAGRKHKITQKVTLHISKGRKLVEIHDFAGRQSSYAIEQLKRDGFNVQSAYNQSDTVPKDCVIQTNPPAHTMAEEGSTVTIMISMGSKNSSVQVPKLTDMPLSEAQRICAEYNLTPKVERVPSEKPEGTVLTQSLAVDSLADRGSEIELTVSTGEIPTVSAEIEVVIPIGYTGDFQFWYYVDGNLDTVKGGTDVRDISLSGARTIKYTLQGRLNETKTLAIKVNPYRDPDNSAWFYEIEVDFSQDPPTQIERFKNSDVFIDLLNSTSSNTSSDTSSDNSSSDTSSSDTSGSSTSSTTSDVSNADLQAILAALNNRNLGYGNTSSYSSSNSAIQQILSKYGYGTNSSTSDLSSSELQILLAALKGGGLGT